MKKFVLLILLTCTFSSNAQNRVVGVGTYPLTKDVSFNFAKDKALEEAKKDALRKGGVSETISSYQNLSTSSINDKLSEVFIENISLSINGTLKDIEAPLVEKIEVDGIEYVEVKISAKVKKYKTKDDASFQARVEGLLPSYKSCYDTSCNFDIRVIPSKDCYLKVFYFSETEAQILYPITIAENKEEDYKKFINLFKNKMISKDQIFKLNYLSPHADKEIETGKFIFVITKNDYPFNDVYVDEDGLYTKTYLDKVLQWYLNIEPNEKNIFYEQISVIR